MAGTRDTSKIHQVLLVDTAGDPGGISVGSVTTSAVASASDPVRTEGATVPLSVDLSGKLRVTGTGGGGSGDASAANQVTGNASLASIDTKMTTLETGKATGAKQDTGNTSLASIDTKLTSTNTKLDTLETGKSTAALQTTGNTSLSSIDTKLTATNTKLDSVITAVDTLETLIAATNTALGTANTHLTDIEAAAEDVTTPIPVKAQGAVVTFVPVLDTAAYTANDVLWTAITTGNLVLANDQPMLLQSLTVIDKDDEGPQMTLYFFSSNVTFGTVNGAPSISDSDAVNLLGYVDIASADFKDLGGVKVAYKNGLSMPIIPVSGARNIYVAATTTGTPTYTTASDISVRLGVI